VPEFWASVRHDAGHYAAFLISFLVIAAAWRDHHDIFRYVRRVDSRLLTLNFGWLLMIVLNPFATRLLTAPGHPDLQTHGSCASSAASASALTSTPSRPVRWFTPRCRRAPAPAAPTG
jgi:uncharacterized membrane protein